MPMPHVIEIHWPKRIPNTSLTFDVIAPRIDTINHTLVAQIIPDFAFGSDVVLAISAAQSPYASEWKPVLLSPARYAPPLLASRLA